MLVSARPPAACLPLPRCAFASLPHWFISSLIHWTPVLFILWTEAANQWSSGPLLHVEQCSFCEQKQRCGTAPRGTLFILWTETTKQWDNASAPHDQYCRACAWGYETLRPAPLHRCALNRCAIRAPQTIGRAQQRVPTTLSSHCAALPMLPAYCSVPTLGRFGSVRASRGRGGAKCSKLELRQETLILSRLQ